MGVSIIAKNQNTFAKRAREMERKRKAEEKRSRREQRKAADPADIPGEETQVLDETPVEDTTIED